MITEFYSTKGPSAVGVQNPLPVEPGTRNTYRYALNDITPVAAPTDIFMIQGSATKTVRIKRIAIYGESTAAGSIGLQLIRRSTQFATQGTATFTPIAAALHDTLDASTPATAVVSYIQTANLTAVGTANGILDIAMLTFGNAGAVPLNSVIWEFSTRNDKPIILRGLTDFLFIGGFGDALPTGAKLYISIETEEDNS